MDDNAVSGHDQANVIPLDFGTGGNLALGGLDEDVRRELAGRVAKERIDIAVDIARRRAKLQSTVADTDNVVASAKSLDGTKADFNITQTSESASGTIEVSVHKNNNLALFILIALGILAVVGLIVLGGR